MQIPDNCPAENLLKVLSGKWKPQLFRLAIEGPMRFNTLLKQLPGCTRQSLNVALKDLENEGILSRTVIKEKPLHIEYSLTEKGASLIGIFRDIELILKQH